MCRNSTFSEEHALTRVVSLETNFSCESPKVSRIEHPTLSGFASSYDFREKHFLLENSLSDQRLSRAGEFGSTFRDQGFISQGSESDRNW